MRRPLVAAMTAALLLVAVPSVASAAPATRFTDHAVVIDCGFLQNDDGVAAAFAVNSTEDGPFGDLTFWRAPSTPETSDPTLVSVAADVSGTDSSLSADFTLVDLSTGDPAGTAELRVTLEPNGPAEPIDERFKDGNRWQKVTGTSQPMTVSGTLEVPGAEPFDASGCLAAMQDIQFFATNPSSFVDRFENFSLSCSWETTGGFVDLFSGADTFGASAELFVSDPSGDYAGFDEAATLTTDGVRRLVGPVRPARRGDGPVGAPPRRRPLASNGDVVRTKDGSPPSFVRFTTQLFSVDGSLSVTTPAGSQSLPMDGEHCFAADQQEFDHSVRPAGPKPGPLANDGPDGAIAAKLGKTSRVVTGGNAEAPEEPCTVTDEETQETFEVPFGYTAWWTFTGHRRRGDGRYGRLDVRYGPGGLHRLARIVHPGRLRGRRLRSDVQPPGEGHRPYLRGRDLLGPGGRVRRRLRSPAGPGALGLIARPGRARRPADGERLGPRPLEDDCGPA